MPYTRTVRSPGDPIKSQEWNDATQEVARLESAKVNRSKAEAMSGPLGIGTTSPEAKIHVSGSESGTHGFNAAMTLQNTASGGRKWYLRSGATGTATPAGGFSIADDVGYRIVIQSDGHVGIGTTNPRGHFDVDGSGDIWLTDDGLSPGTQSVFLTGHVYLGPYSNHDIAYLQARRSDNSGTVALRLRTYNSGTLTEAIHIAGDGKVGIGVTSPTQRLHVQGGAYCDGATWHNASSIEYKKDVSPVALDEALATLAGLAPVTFKYKDGDEREHVGFIAEHVPELVASSDRKGLSPLDIVAVLTRVVQHQQDQIEELRQRLDEGRRSPARA